jgi:hypothetical protein
MKHNIFHCICFVFVIACNSCAENPNRVNFIIPTNDRKILIPVQLNDSIIAQYMTFDTGFYDGAFILDSTFVASHRVLNNFNIPPDTLRTGSGWGFNRVLDLKYNTDQTVKIGNTALTYHAIEIANWKSAMYNDNTDGLFNIPQNDTTHIWELNFEHSYLEIHPATNFRMPENCFLISMERHADEKLGVSNSFSIKIPMQIQYADGDTLTINSWFGIDTGMAWDIVLSRPDALKFLNKKDDAIWTQYLGDYYYRHYWVNAVLFDQFRVDSLRIYRFDNLHFSMGNLIGTNFLKRFNVFFDMKHKQLGLQPIKNFQRVINPDYRRFHYSAPKNSKGKYIVTKLADYESNYYKGAGLQLGDEIVAVNDTLYKNITYKQKDEFYKEDTLILDIIREGKPLKIVVPVNKNEEQGD